MLGWGQVIIKISHNGRWDAADQPMVGGMQQISHNGRWVAGLLAWLVLMCTHLARFLPDFLEEFFAS